MSKRYVLLYFLLCITFISTTSCKPIGEDKIKQDLTKSLISQFLPNVLMFPHNDIFIPENASDVQSIHIVFNQEILGLLSSVDINNYNITFSVDNPELLSIVKPNVSISTRDRAIIEGFYLPITTNGKPGRVTINAKINGASSATNVSIVTAKRTIQIVPEDVNQIISNNDNLGTITVIASSDLPNDTFSIDMKSSNPKMQFYQDPAFDVMFEATPKTIETKFMYSLQTQGFDTPMPTQITAQINKSITATFFPIICWNQENAQILGMDNSNIVEVKNNTDPIIAKIVNCVNNTPETTVNFRIDTPKPDLFDLDQPSKMMKPKAVSQITITPINIKSIADFPTLTTVYATEQKTSKSTSLKIHNGYTKLTIDQDQLNLEENYENNL